MTNHVSPCLSFHLSTTSREVDNSLTSDLLTKVRILLAERGIISKNGKPILRGIPISDQIVTDWFPEDEGYCGLSDTSEQANIVLSQSTIDTQRIDALFMENVELRRLQATLDEKANSLCATSESKYNAVLSIMKEHVSFNRW